MSEELDEWDALDIVWDWATGKSDMPDLTYVRLICHELRMSRQIIESKDAEIAELRPGMISSPVVKEIHKERQRQVEAKGWDTKHDDRHIDGQLAIAASCYADPDPEMTCATEDGTGVEYPDRWAWDASDWKPKSRRRDLIRAGALIVAEIDRLDREAARKDQA